MLNFCDSAVAKGSGVFSTGADQKNESIMPFLPHVPSSAVTTIRSSRKAKPVLVSKTMPRFAAADIAGRKTRPRVPFRRLQKRAKTESNGKGGKAAGLVRPAESVAVPPPPCSPEARLKSPTRMPLPVGLDPDSVSNAPKPSTLSPKFSSLPDPFAELEAVERSERIEKKNELGPETMARISLLQNRIKSRNAVYQWKTVMLMQRHEAHLAHVERLRVRSAGLKIVRAWRTRIQRDVVKKQAAASLVLARHRLQISVGLRACQRRGQAKMLRKFVKNHTMPRFCQMIHMLRFKAIIIQRCFRDYLAVSKARVRLLKMRFDRRVVERCDAIRAENHQRVLEYEEEKIRLMHVELQKTEDKWHESHARVRSIIVKAASAASRAKRRRRATRMAGQTTSAEAVTLLAGVHGNISMNEENSKKLKRKKKASSHKTNTPAPADDKENLGVRLQKNKRRNEAVLQDEAKKLVDSVILSAAQSPRKRGQNGVPLPAIAEIGSFSNSDAPVLDALALQFMHLPPDIKKQLLKGILKRRRRNWARCQTEARRKHSNQVETHRAINVQDIKDLISGKLQVSGLEKQTLVRFKFEPLKMYSKGITVDLDRAIDNACKHCVWDF